MTYWYVTTGTMLVFAFEIALGLYILFAPKRSFAWLGHFAPSREWLDADPTLEPRMYLEHRMFGMLMATYASLPLHTELTRIVFIAAGWATWNHPVLHSREPTGSALAFRLVSLLVAVVITIKPGEIIHWLTRKQPDFSPFLRFRGAMLLRLFGISTLFSGAHWVRFNLLTY